MYLHLNVFKKFTSNGKCSYCKIRVGKCLNIIICNVLVYYYSIINFYYNLIVVF